LNELVRFFLDDPSRVDDAVGHGGVDPSWLAHSAGWINPTSLTASPAVARAAEHSSIDVISAGRWQSLVEKATQLDDPGHITDWVVMLPNSSGTEGLVIPDDASLAQARLAFFHRLGDAAQTISFEVDQTQTAAGYRGDIDLLSVKVHGPTHCGTPTEGCIPHDPGCTCERQVFFDNLGLQALSCQCLQHGCR
jgi:hypothetical protein